MTRGSLAFLGTWMLLGAAGTAAPAQAADDPGFTLDCASPRFPCAEVLPGATRFAKVGGQPFFAGTNAADEAVGWVVLSLDVVDIKAYSGKPLVTLVGLSTSAKITGARVIHHSEPILLVGIPEKALTDFVAFYTGRHATAKVVVGSSPDPDVVTVDVISGATVTALAQNQTILESAARLGVAAGVIEAAALNPGAFVPGERPWTWDEIVAAGAIGRLTVSQTDMGLPPGPEPFIDVWFTIADAPHIGGGLLGPREYAYQIERLQPGEHLLVMVGRGTSSFKGSGFVRGGIFDRVRLEQGLNQVFFRDTDYQNLGDFSAEGAPDMKEGAIFTTHKGRLDPGAAFDLVFIGSRYDGKGGFSRDFTAFNATHRLPKSVYVVENEERDLGAEITSQAWYNQRYKVAVLGAFLFLLMGLFVARPFLTGNMKRLEHMHVAFMVVSFVVLGLWLHAQPSVTQVLTFVGAAVGQWSWDLFMSEPLLFVFWIAIAVVTVIWGRGVFCGWACPYGSMSELLFKLGTKLGLKPFELPEKWHRPGRFIRYGVLAVLIGTFIASPQLGEQLAEIEPFKSTFFVAPWTREVLFFGWWIVLAVLSLFWFRPFCRYLCPLGAALALPSSFRLSGPYRRSFCSSCTICTKGCEPRAIRPNGTIDHRECLQCMECEANYRDKEVCPPLVGLDRLRIASHSKGVQPNPAKVAQLERDAKTVRRFQRDEAS